MYVHEIVVISTLHDEQGGNNFFSGSPSQFTYLLGLKLLHYINEVGILNIRDRLFNDFLRESTR